MNTIGMIAGLVLGINPQQEVNFQPPPSIVVNKVMDILELPGDNNQPACLRIYSILNKNVR